MKIRTTLTLQYAGLTAAVFFVFVMAVYYVSEHSRSNAFFRNLQSEAITKAHLFLKNQVDAKTMQSIYLNNQKFIDEVEVAVYTTDFKILYHDALQNDIVKETPEMIKRILQRKNINFYVDEYQAIGLVYPFERNGASRVEKTADAVVVGLDADWSDVGSWSALWEVSPKDEQGNVLSGDAWVHNSENCYINSDEKLVAAIGVENLVIVSTKDAVLVMNRERSQDVKKAVEFLKQNQRSEYKRHREIYRPWGRCDVVVQTPRFNVNRITVKPGGAFSMQMHHHRAEHWVILAGTGQVTVNGKQFLLTENQSTFIPIGAEHSLENPGRIPLEVLEIQSGSYLGEDDIIRIKDQYGRC